MDAPLSGLRLTPSIPAPALRCADVKDLNNDMDLLVFEILQALNDDNSVRKTFEAEVFTEKKDFNLIRSLRKLEPQIIKMKQVYQQVQDKLVLKNMMIKTLNALGANQKLYEDMSAVAPAAAAKLPVVSIQPSDDEILARQLHAQLNAIDPDEVFARQLQEQEWGHREIIPRTPGSRDLTKMFDVTHSNFVERALPVQRYPSQMGHAGYFPPLDERIQSVANEARYQRSPLADSILKASSCFTTEKIEIHENSDWICNPKPNSFILVNSGTSFKSISNAQECVIVFDVDCLVIGILKALKSTIHVLRSNVKLGEIEGCVIHVHPGSAIDFRKSKNNKIVLHFAEERSITFDPPESRKDNTVEEYKGG